MKLPCSHISAVRKNEDLCDRMWHLSFYKSCHRALQTDHMDDGDANDGECSIDVNSVCSRQEKESLSQVYTCICASQAG